MLDVGWGHSSELVTVLPVEIDDVVYKAKRDIECVGDHLHCLPLVIVLDNPLSQVRGICDDHLQTGETRPTAAGLACPCRHVQIPIYKLS